MSLGFPSHVCSVLSAPGCHPFCQRNSKVNSSAASTVLYLTEWKQHPAIWWQSMRRKGTVATLACRNCLSWDRIAKLIRKQVWKFLSRVPARVSSPSQWKVSDEREPDLLSSRRKPAATRREQLPGTKGGFTEINMPGGSGSWTGCRLKRCLHSLFTHIVESRALILCLMWKEIKALVSLDNRLWLKITGRLSLLLYDTEWVSAGSSLCTIDFKQSFVWKMLLDYGKKAFYNPSANVVMFNRHSTLITDW